MANILKIVCKDCKRWVSKDENGVWRHEVKGNHWCNRPPKEHMKEGENSR